VVISLLVLGRAVPAWAADGSAVDEDLATAKAELGYLNFDKAADLFATVRARSERGSVPWLQATFGQAVAVQQGTPATPERVTESAALYNELIEAAPATPLAARSTMNLGRLAELSDYYQDRIDLPAARERYQAVVQTWPDDPIAGEATLRLAGSYIQTFNADDVRTGIAVLEQWLASHPPQTEPLASAMHQYLGDTYFYPLGDLRKSLDAYMTADKVGWTDEADVGRVLWRIAVIADRVGDRDAAVRYYTKVITDAPTSGKPYEAQVALKRLGAPAPEIKLLRRRPTTATAGEAPPTPTTGPSQGVAADAR